MASSRDPAVAERLKQGIDDADRNLVFRLETKIGVDLDVSDLCRLRRARLATGGVPDGNHALHLGLEAIAVGLAERRPACGLPGQEEGSDREPGQHAHDSILPAIAADRLPLAAPA